MDTKIWCGEVAFMSHERSQESGKTNRCSLTFFCLGGKRYKNTDGERKLPHLATWYVPVPGTLPGTYTGTQGATGTAKARIIGKEKVICNSE